MSGELHEAIEEAIESVHGPLSRLTLDMDAMADAILAMPEMHEIKAILSCAMVVLGYDDDPIKQQAKIEHLREAVAAASPPVVDWVLGGQS